MNHTARRILAAAALIGTASLATACASQTPPKTTDASASKTSSPRPSASAAEASGVALVPGYGPGEFPPVPLFTMPDISMLDASLSGFTIDVDKKITPRPGLDIRPAACGSPVERATARGTALLYGDGSGKFTGPNGSVVNYGDGSGSYTVGGVTATVYGDGSGSFESKDLTIQNFGDGSGKVTTPDGTTQVFGDGSAQYSGGKINQHNFGDGSAEYTDGTVSIQNFGDGAGKYDDGTITVQNFGDGTGQVNGAKVKVKPLPKVAPVGKFPPMGAIKPVKSCGTTITLSDGVLFDFDKADLRPQAAATMTELAGVLKELKVPSAEIGGHTDSIGDDAYNQDLSDRRAKAVVDALKKNGVQTSLTATGYGETVPVAANEVDGHDNPEGRQLNRRVEIYIPAF